MTTDPTPPDRIEPLAPWPSDVLNIGETAVEALAKLGAEASGISITTVEPPPGDAGLGLPAVIPVAVVRGDKPEVRDLSQLLGAWRTKPRAKAGTAKAQTLRSFIDLTARHMTEHTAVFADSDWTKPSLTTVVDYHRLNGAAPEGGAVEVGAAENLRHRIVYPFPLSEEWKAWIKMNGEPMEQGEFAAFLEDRIAELSSPTDFERVELERQFGTTLATPADLIQLARGLQVNVDSVVKSAVTLQTGEGQLQWEESHKDASGKPLKVPGLFMLQIAPFFMGDLARIPARLRYRVSGSRVRWTIQIWRPEFFVTERVRNDLLLVANRTGLPVFEGAPES